MSVHLGVLPPPPPIPKSWLRYCFPLHCVLWHNLDEDSFDMLYKNYCWAAISLTQYEGPRHHMKEKICYHPLITILWFVTSILRYLWLNLGFLRYSHYYAVQESWIVQPQSSFESLNNKYKKTTFQGFDFPHALSIY